MRGEGRAAAVFFVEGEGVRRDSRARKPGARRTKETDSELFFLLTLNSKSVLKYLVNDKTVFYSAH